MKATKQKGIKKMNKEMDMRLFKAEEESTRQTWKLFSYVRKLMKTYGFGDEFDYWFEMQISSTETPCGNWIWHHLNINPYRVNWKEFVEFPMLLSRFIVFNEIQNFNIMIHNITLHLLASFMLNHHVRIGIQF